jgi:hypothetical protein
MPTENISMQAMTCCHLLGYGALWSVREPTFRRNVFTFWTQVSGSPDIRLCRWRWYVPPKRRLAQGYMALYATRRRHSEISRSPAPLTNFVPRRETNSISQGCKVMLSSQQVSWISVDFKVFYTCIQLCSNILLLQGTTIRNYEYLILITCTEHQFPRSTNRAWSTALRVKVHSGAP